MICPTSSPIPATHGLSRFVWVRYPSVRRMRKTAAYAGCLFGQRGQTIIESV